MQHSIECYCSKNSRDKKIAVLHFAQAVELALKAALVELNVSIYEKNGRTINTHEALASLAKYWTVDRLPGQARVELLIDERNAIQHRYGAVDDVTLDYHMQTAYDFLNEILVKEFDTELGDWIKATVEQDAWERVRFVVGEDAKDKPIADAIVADRSPTLDFVDGFSRYERRIRLRIGSVIGVEFFRGSTLDVIMKVLCNIPQPDEVLIEELPSVYRLRNKVVHGEEEPAPDAVAGALKTLDATLTVFDAVPNDLLEASIQASAKGYRGTNLPPLDAPPLRESDA